MLGHPNASKKPYILTILQNYIQKKPIVDHIASVNAMNYSVFKRILYDSRLLPYKSTGASVSGEQLPVIKGIIKDVIETVGDYSCAVDLLIIMGLESSIIFGALFLVKQKVGICYRNNTVTINNNICEMLFKTVQ